MNLPRILVAAISMVCFLAPSLGECAPQTSAPAVCAICPCSAAITCCFNPSDQQPEPLPSHAVASTGSEPITLAPPAQSGLAEAPKSLSDTPRSDQTGVIRCTSPPRILFCSFLI